MSNKYVLAHPANVFVFLRRDEEVEEGHTMESYVPYTGLLGLWTGHDVDGAAESLMTAAMVLGVGTVVEGVDLAGDAMQWFRVVQRVYDADGDLSVYIVEIDAPGKKRFDPNHDDTWLGDAASDEPVTPDTREIVVDVDDSPDSTKRE